VIEVRRAELEDDDELARVDVATWTPKVTPAPARLPGAGFFEERRRPGDVLVGRVGGAVVGYAHVTQLIPVPSHQHVLELMGLAVDPSWQGHGVGRRLLHEAVDEARRRGARKLSLRVLGTNAVARRLYEADGFVV